VTKSQDGDTYRFLEFSYFSKCYCSWSESMGFLYSTGSMDLGWLSSCLVSQLLSWGFGSSVFSCCLLCSCHSKWVWMKYVSCSRNIYYYRINWVWILYNKVREWETRPFANYIPQLDLFWTYLFITTQEVNYEVITTLRFNLNYYF